MEVVSMPGTKTPRIEARPNGPYVVRDVEDLKAADGAAIAPQPVVALCRCGSSANKPFCDGTHNRIGFSSAKLADPGRDRRDTYSGRRIAIHDNRAICAHAGYCSGELAAVFKYGSEPWIDPDGAPIQSIIDTIRKCPSGALSYSVDGVEQRDQARSPGIAMTRDGPYAVVGGIELPGETWGAGASTEHYTLCRCGASKNKPFCDGSHWSVGFKDG
jgi:CDGSH-type Zn-finger protein